MVFPHRAKRVELAADHLYRLLGKSRLDGLVHKCCVAEDADTRGANKPKCGSQRIGDEAERHSNADQSRVELGNGSTCETHIKIASFQFPNPIHPSNHQENNEEKEPVCEESVKSQHGEDHHIVAGEVAEVIVDSRLGFREVGRLGDSLEVEKLAEGFEVGESVG